MLALQLHFLSLLATNFGHLATPVNPLGLAFGSLGPSSRVLGRFLQVLWQLWAATAATQAVIRARGAVSGPPRYLSFLHFD